MLPEKAWYAPVCCALNTEEWYHLPELHINRTLLVHPSHACAAAADRWQPDAQSIDPLQQVSACKGERGGGGHLFLRSCSPTLQVTPGGTLLSVTIR
jgi:hypothetical protein